MVCTTCGQPLGAGSRFCSECGEPVRAGSGATTVDLPQAAMAPSPSPSPGASVGGPPPAGSPPAQAAGPPPPQGYQEASGATAALVLGILGIVPLPLILSIPAIIVGSKAKKRARAIPGQPGLGMAKAGYICGIIGTILGALNLAFWLAIVILAQSAGPSTNSVLQAVNMGAPPKTEVTNQPTTAANAASAEVANLLQGIPQSADTLGNASAPVTLQFFGDLECPICSEFTLKALPALINKYVRTGKLRIEYRSLQTATRETGTFNTQQRAALAAGKQNKMWYFVELFYHEQGEEGSGYVTESYLQGLAAQVPGLNVGEWSTARNDPAFASQVSSDAQAANAAGFTGTPSFLIGKTGGPYKNLEANSLTDPSSFELAINQRLKA